MSLPTATPEEHRTRSGARRPGEGPHRLAIHGVWLGKLRWVAAIGQLITIGFVVGPLGVAVPVGPLVLLVGVTLVSNALFWWWSTRQRQEHASRALWSMVLGLLMLLDLVVLTAMLALTGGPTNPFVVFYFVNLALSGVVLSPRWAWSLSLLAIGGYALIAWRHAPIDILQDPNRLLSVSALRAASEASLPIALYGAWIAFAAAALVIVNFVTLLTNELRASNRLRRQAERRRARSEKLEALGTLAAGAAHELASPLSTIAVAVGEVRRQIETSGVDLPEAADDLDLVRRELARCRTILDRMSTDSGQATAGAPERMTVAEVLEETLEELPSRDRVRTAVKSDAESLAIHAPRTALAQALRALVQNGLDATDEVDPAGEVEVTADQLSHTLRLRIVDRGPGMPPEVLQRASEPFFTTKPPGRGMGLGLFLAMSVIERLGGSLRLESNAGEGTTVVVVLPLDETSQEKPVTTQ